MGCRSRLGPIVGGVRDGDQGAAGGDADGQTREQASAPGEKQDGGAGDAQEGEVIDADFEMVDDDKEK